MVVQSIPLVYKLFLFYFILEGGRAWRADSANEYMVPGHIVTSQYQILYGVCEARLHHAAL